MPSYRDCAARIVRLDVNPNVREPACCNVLVVYGAKGRRLRCPGLTRSTTKSLPSNSPRRISRDVYKRQCLHYGQECFEGLKAYSTKDGGIQLFRPDENAKRMQKSCERLLMPIVPVEKFIDACMQVVKANAAWVPPYGSGATLYLRPYVIGIGCLLYTSRCV